MKQNTITRKLMLRILIIGGLALLGIGLVFPSVFYHVMKPHFYKQISSVVSSGALRQSYIWNKNSQLHEIATSARVSEAVQEYYAENGEKEDAKEAILEYLPVIHSGLNAQEEQNEENGYIVFSNYLLLFTDQGDLFYSPDAQWTADIFRESDWYRTFDRSQEIRGHIPVIGNEETGQFFCVVESFWAGGIHCFAVNMVMAEEVLMQLSEFEDFGLRDYLIYCNGEVLYSSQDESVIDLDACPQYLFQGKQYETLMWEDADETVFAVLCTYVDEDFRLVVRVSKEQILEPYFGAFRYFQIMLWGVTLLLLVAFGISLKSTLHRLKNLEKSMNGVRNGTCEEIAEEDGENDEISSLTNTFHMMLDKLRKDQAREEQMQYMLLVSAIDPHYIYNTLNTVTALAELGRCQEVVEVNNALIGTLKDRLKMKNYKTFDTVQAERETLEQYMVIQRYLCWAKIQFSFQVSEEDQNLLIPKNIIQPLVENAIKHGILCRDDDEIKEGKIDVTVEGCGEQIRITVQDNGAGMEEETVQRFFSREPGPVPEGDVSHIGVNNVRMRLKYLYRGNYEMTVDSRKNEGTVIRIVLPTRSEISGAYLF